TFSGAILSEQPKALDFLPLLRRFRGRAMVKAYRFRDRREREMVVRLHLTVPGFAFSRPQTGRGKVGRPVVVSIVAARSLLGIDPSFSSPPFDPDRDRIRFVIVDFVIAAVRPFVVAGTGSAVAAAVVAAAAAAVVVPAFADLAAIADSVDSAGLVCSSAEAMAKGRARAVAEVVSCFLVPRSSSSHNRSCPSLLYFSVRA